MIEVWIFMGLQLVVFLAGLLLVRLATNMMREANEAHRQAGEWFKRLNDMFGVELGDGGDRDAG